MGFADDVEKVAEPVRRAILKHPFVTGIGDGTLDVERFKFYVRQDYVYLIDYSRVLALASARAPDLETMGWFARLLDATMNTEMELHRSYCSRFGISRDELEETIAAPTTLAYTSFLLNVAYQGSFAELAASFLPCQWGYWEIGDHLARKGKPDGAPLYREWIEMYISPEYRSRAEWARDLADRVAAEAGPAELARMERGLLHQPPVRVPVLGHGLQAGRVARLRPRGAQGRRYVRSLTLAWLRVLVVLITAVWALAACGGGESNPTAAPLEDAGVSMGGAALGGNAETTLLAREALGRPPAGDVAWVAHEVRLDDGRTLEHSHEFAFVYAKEGIHRLQHGSDDQQMERGEGGRDPSRSESRPRGSPRPHPCSGRYDWRRQALRPRPGRPMPGPPSRVGCWGVSRGPRWRPSCWYGSLLEAAPASTPTQDPSSSTSSPAR